MFATGTRLANMARFVQINAPVDSLAPRRSCSVERRRERERGRERKEKRSKRRSATHYWRVSGNRLSAAAWRPEIERSQPSSEIEVQEGRGGEEKKRVGSPFIFTIGSGLNR